MTAKPQTEPANALPKYTRPPVVETVIGVQFEELTGFRAAHFGAYWDRIGRDRFPKITDQPRLPSTIEAFQRSLPNSLESIEFLPAGSPGRVWFESAAGNELVQLQANRFLYNWKKSTQSEQYPSFEANREKFLTLWVEFRDFCSEMDIGKISPQLCEVTYFNDFPPNPGESAIELFGRVFTGLTWKNEGNFLSKPERATFNRVYEIPDRRGRLYVEAAIAVKVAESSELVRLTMTARMNCKSSTDGELFEEIQIAHDWVVKGFAAVTNLDVQRERWGRAS